MNHRRTVLYIFDRSNHNTSVLAAITTIGFDVLSTDSPTEGVALLYIMRQVNAVVLESEVIRRATFDVCGSLRAIRPEIPVVLNCGDPSHTSPSLTNDC